jgi:hypothetical protein
MKGEDVDLLETLAEAGILFAVTFTLWFLRDLLNVLF